MRIRTVFNYDYENEKFELNDEPSLTNCDDYESLGEKLARYTGFSDSNLIYDEDLDITDDPSFDIADYDINECREVLNSANKVNNKKQMEVSNEDLNSTSDTDQPDELQEGRESTSANS